MAPIIRTCKFGLSLLLLSALPVAAQAAKENAQDRAIESYVSARLAEIGNRDSEALKTYIKLHKISPDSEVLSDRLFTSAIRSGDMENAVRAVRALELQKAVSNEGTLLLFADAFKRKNWGMASLAASELESQSYLGFMAPILRSWIDVAQGKEYSLPDADPKTSPYFAFYATDQRVYMDLATSKYLTSKPLLRSLALSNSEYARDLLIRSAPIYAAQGERDFASALVGAASDRDYAQAAAIGSAKDPQSKITPEEALGILHARVANTLIEQKNPETGLVIARIAQWLAPNNAVVRLTLADAMDAQGLGDQAQALRAAIPISSPYWPRAVSDSLAQLSAAKQPQAALELALDARKSRPQSANMTILVAQYQMEAGNISDAITTYRKLVDDADNARADARQRAIYKLMLATALDNTGDWTSAHEQLNQAQRLDPNNPSILNYLGYSLLEHGGDVQMAGALIAQAYKLSPQSTAITDSFGWAKYHQGEYVEAVDLLEIAARAAGADATINEHLGDAYWQAGRKIDARYAWRVASRTASDSAALRLSTKIDVGLTAATQHD